MKSNKKSTYRIILALIMAASLILQSCMLAYADMGGEGEKPDWARENPPEENSMQEPQYVSPHNVRVANGSGSDGHWYVSLGDAGTEEVKIVADAGITGVSASNEHYIVRTDGGCAYILSSGTGSGSMITLSFSDGSSETIILDVKASTNSREQRTGPKDSLGDNDGQNGGANGNAGGNGGSNKAPLHIVTIDNGTKRQGDSVWDVSIGDSKSDYIMLSADYEISSIDVSNSKYFFPIKTGESSYKIRVLCNNDKQTVMMDTGLTVNFADGTSQEVHLSATGLLATVMHHAATPTAKIGKIRFNNSDWGDPKDKLHKANDTYKITIANGSKEVITIKTDYPIKTIAKNFNTGDTVTLISSNEIQVSNFINNGAGIGILITWADGITDCISINYICKVKSTSEPQGQPDVSNVEYNPFDVMFAEENYEAYQKAWEAQNAEINAQIDSEQNAQKEQAGKVSNNGSTAKINNDSHGNANNTSEGGKNVDTENNSNQNDNNHSNESALDTAGNTTSTTNSNENDNALTP